ncbi:MAG: hypothetical protein R3B74_11960 [Nitrospirales bacterium]|nr:hypothetical protein [Nitrospirales bacterium]
MAIIGVIHCPTCQALVNANWKICLACSVELVTEASEKIPLSPQALLKDRNLQSDDPKDRGVPFVPGLVVGYRIPIVKNPVDYDWEWHEGTVDLIDEAAQQVLIIPDAEEEPWRWVSTCYVQPKGND